MQTIFVSPDFPLNRRMRKAVRRGKLQVVREGGERLTMGREIPPDMSRTIRTFSSPLVCFASREGDNGDNGGGSTGEVTDAQESAIVDAVYKAAASMNMERREPSPDLNNLTPEQIYNKTIDSIVVVRTTGGCGDSIAVRTGDGEGSGVVVGDNLVATNCHVVDSGGRITVSPANSDQSSAHHKPIEATIVAASDCDVCLLKTQGLSLPPVEIGEAGKLKIGHPVYAIGVPLYLGGTLSNGIVSRLWDPYKHPLPAPLIQTNAAISSGSSGGGLFDACGRLVGITSFSRGNLNFAIPAEMIDYLWERVGLESEIRQKLADALAASDATAIINLAAEIVFSLETFHDPGHILEEMGSFSARLGGKKLPHATAKWFASKLESDSVDSEERDRIAIHAASVWSGVGMEHVDKAMELVEKIDDPMLRAIGCAKVASNCARHEGRPFEKAWKIRQQIWDVPEEMRGPDSPMFPRFVNALTGVFAEMYDSEEALKIADKHIKETENDEHFLLYVEALAKIASALKRQGVAIGAAAIFHYAIHAATEFWSRGVGTPERLAALGDIAVHGAECGYGASGAFKRMRHILKEGSISDPSEDRMPGISYSRKIEARGLEAVARAITGEFTEGLWVKQCMKCIPVLDHLPVALVCYACKLRQWEAKNRETRNPPVGD